MTVTTRRHVHDLRAAQVLAAGIMPRLEWRHSGLGMLQAYVHEGGDSETRIHVWDARLRRDGITDSGALHDHRFDMTSIILLGTLRHQEIEVVPYAEQPDPYADPYVMYEIKSNFRKSKNGAELVELPGCYSCAFRNIDMQAGDEYFFPRGAFHGTYTPADPLKWGPTITLVRKTNQREVNARIIAPSGVPVVYAFDAPLPESTWRPILDEAVRWLERAAHPRRAPDIEPSDFLESAGDR